MSEFEWREQIGVRIMYAMNCTHEGEEFGSKAVCVTCFANTQRIGELIERERAEARAAGAAEVRARALALADEWYPGDPGPRRMTSWGQLARETCAQALRAALAAEGSA